MSGLDTIAARIKEYRQLAGLNQTQLAEKVGITRAAISAIEKGKSGARNTTLSSIALALGIKTEDLLTKESVFTSRQVTTLQNDTNTQTLSDAWVDVAFVDLPFITYSDFSRFVQQCETLQVEDFPKVRVVQMPDHIYQDAVVLEIRGNSMAPRYPERSRFVLRPLAQQDWSQAQGVHAIVTNNVLRIKRIVSNLNGVLRLRSDANGEETEVVLSEISCLWKVGEGVYYPAED